ncbi:carboxyl transferase domain-containing protein [Streptomyces sp. RB110-2]|uniref:carboxyl transferase domain-containing protein n=1 Tax=Streptomyces sp. RB110-2 TaxID=2794863 RepID=UPI0035AB7D61
MIEEIVDDGEFFEIQPDWASNIVCALTRLDGHVTGVVAKPARRVRRGARHPRPARKAARFVQFCERVLDPAGDPGRRGPASCRGWTREHGGVIRHGAKLLYAYCNATVPRVQLITRKAYGGAYIVMDSSRSIGADRPRWPGPTNEIAGHGRGRGPPTSSSGGRSPRRTTRTPYGPSGSSSNRTELMHPYYGGPSAGLVDDVIDPAATRSALIGALAMLRPKYTELPSRKHGKPPGVRGRRRR